MSTHVPGFSVIFVVVNLRFLHHFVLAKLATSSERFKVFFTYTSLPAVLNLH